MPDIHKTQPMFCTNIMSNQIKTNIHKFMQSKHAEKNKRSSILKTFGQPTNVQRCQYVRVIFHFTKTFWNFCFPWVAYCCCDVLLFSRHAFCTQMNSLYRWMWREEEWERNLRFSMCCVNVSLALSFLVVVVVGQRDRKADKLRLIWCQLAYISYNIQRTPEKNIKGNEFIFEFDIQLGFNM